MDEREGPAPSSSRSASNGYIDNLLATGRFVGDDRQEASRSEPPAGSRNEAASFARQWVAFPSHSSTHAEPAEEAEVVSNNVNLRNEFYGMRTATVAEDAIDTEEGVRNDSSAPDADDEILSTDSTHGAVRQSLQRRAVGPQSFAEAFAQAKKLAGHVDPPPSDMEKLKRERHACSFSCLRIVLEIRCTYLFSYWLNSF